MQTETIEKLIQEEKEIQGPEYIDMRPVLERTLTVGDILAALEGLDPNCPILLEVAAPDEEGSLAYASAYLLNVFEATEGVSRVVLSGALPEASAAYIKEEGL